MFPKYSDWNIQYTTKGLLKHRLAQVLKIIVLAAGVIGAWRIRHDVRGGLMGIVGLVRAYVKVGMLMVLREGEGLVGRL